MNGHCNVDWVLGASVHGIGWIVVLAIAAWLLLAEPLLGRASYRRLEAALDRGAPFARVRCYRQWIWQSWLLALLVMALSIGVLGWTPAQLGLRLAHLPGLPGGLSWATLGVGAMLGLAGFIGAARMASRKARRARTAQPPPPRRMPEGMQILPRNRGERRLFALLAVTAGVTEEIVWRGFLLALLVTLFPRAPMAMPIVAIAVVFGWAHLYQGLTGILATGVLGGMLALLYVVTGSLLPSIVLHAAIDLAALLRPLPATA
jgi:membrane protease YdiL (CAAX protease family)